MLDFKPVKVKTGSCDQTGVLVLEDDYLVAVLVRLDDPVHADAIGRWYLEARFDTLPKVNDPFDDLEDATRWIEDKLACHSAKPC